MTEIQRYVDEPATFLFWEIDEMIAMSSFVFVGILANMLLSSLLVGLAVGYVLKKIKKRSSEGVILHFLYWHGFLKLRNCPPSYIRELTG